MKLTIVSALVVCALAGVSDAQDAQSAYVPLTLDQKYFFSMNKVVGKGAAGAVMLKAAFDQLREEPQQWGDHADSFAVRGASHLGRSFVRQGLAFGVRALDGEDPRYFVSGEGGRWARTRYAMVHTFEARNDRGQWMPAYSLLVSAYGTAFIANTWRPDHRGVGYNFGAGTAAIGLAVGSSIVQEFWPDLKKKVHRLHSLKIPSAPNN